MTTTFLARITAIGATAAMAAAIGIGTAGPALANDVIAVDATTAAPVAAAAVPTAVASRPGTIVVTRHGGRSVTLFAKGEHIRRVLAPGKRPATFSGLTAGRVYTVAIGGQPIGAVVALKAPAAATGLTVRTTDTPGTVALSWRHTSTTATGGRSIRYDVRATSSSSPPVTDTVTGALTTRLSGLDPDAVYTFRVTPHNTAGVGRSTTAVMDRTLGQASGRPASTPVAVAPTPAVAAAPLPAPIPAPVPAPVPAPAPAPAPSTKTIWVCPDGFTETQGQCRKTMAYTYHEEVETSPYTYHSEQQLNTLSVPATFNGSVWTWSCPSGYADGGGQWGVGICKGTVTVSVKDAPPNGWYDTGSAYGHAIDVKDAMPAGYLDDGSQWVLTTAKISKVVAA